MFAPARFAAALIAACTVLYLVACSEAGDVGWANYNGPLAGDRYSPLDKITPANAKDLAIKCELELGEPGGFQTGPVVVGNVMYVTTVHTTVAMDATNCKPIWRHKIVQEGDEPWPVNRGVTYMNGQLFRGSADGRIFALDAKTGQELWRVRAADPKLGEYYSAAPIAWNGLVFLAPAASDTGIKGRMTAFDAATGKEVWRFNTIPTGNEPGAETWEDPDSTKHGGGGSWTSYALDPETGEVFISVANPAPTFMPDRRPGDNLYTNSLVVLDARTGKLNWYHQFNPHDGFDYDLGAAPILFKDKNGNRRVALGSKDGHVYVLDRDTHKLLSKTPVTTIVYADKPTPEGVFACPGSLGGVEWNGPAYSPATGALYAGSVDWCATFKSGPEDYEPGPQQGYVGTSAAFQTIDKKNGWIVALDAISGEVLWRHHSTSPVLAAVTPTAGGVLFGGESDGDFLVLDAKSGEVLKRQDMGGSVAGGIITYSVGGAQYVALAVGNISRVGFSTRKSEPRIIVMTTGLGAANQPVKLSAVPESEKAIAATGSTLFQQYCSACHGSAGQGANGPSLVGKNRKNAEQIAEFVKNPTSAMPRFYPATLTDNDVKLIADFVAELK